MKLISWNVNGIRACYKKGFVEFIEREDPDILAVQETKAEPGQCEPAIINAAGRTSYWSSAKKKGYSGTATFLKPELLRSEQSDQAFDRRVLRGIGREEFDSEGRFLITDHGHFTLYNIYFVNGGSGPERHEFKQRFLRELYIHLKEQIQNGKPIIVTGDYNIAHREIDVYDSVGLANASGFLQEERKWLDEFFALGFVDTYRHFYPRVGDKYTWWSMYERGRISNRGWRIDYFCVSKDLVGKLQRAEILDGQQGSDHCPVVLELAF